MLFEMDNSGTDHNNSKPHKVADALRNVLKSPSKQPILQSQKSQGIILRNLPENFPVRILDDPGNVKLAFVGVPYVLYIPIDLSSYPQVSVFITCPNGTSADHSTLKTNEGITVNFIPMIVGEHSVLFMANGRSLSAPFTVDVIQPSPPINNRDAKLRVGERIVCYRVMGNSMIKVSDFEIQVFEQKSGAIMDCEAQVDLCREGYFTISMIALKRSTYILHIKVNGLYVDKPLEVEINAIRRKQKGVSVKENLEKRANDIDSSKRGKNSVRRRNSSRETIKSVDRRPSVITIFKPLNSGDLDKDENPESSVDYEQKKKHVQFGDITGSEDKEMSSTTISSTQLKKLNISNRGTSKTTFEPADPKLRLSQSDGPTCKVASPTNSKKSKRGSLKLKFQNESTKETKTPKIKRRSFKEKRLSKKFNKMKAQKNVLCDSLESTIRQIFVSVPLPENFEGGPFVSTYTVTVKNEITIPATVSHGPDNTLLVQFVPTQIGRYNIQIYCDKQPMYGEEEIKINVDTLIRSSSIKNKVGERNLFNVGQILDKKKTSISSYPFNELSVIVAGPEIVPGKLMPSVDGSENMFIEFIPPKSGLYRGQVYFKGAAILPTPLGLPVDIELIQQVITRQSVTSSSSSSSIMLLLRPIINQNFMNLDYKATDITAELTTDIN